MIALRRLTKALSPESASDQVAATDPKEIVSAWERTQELQAIYLALLEAATKGESDRGDEEQE